MAQHGGAKEGVRDGTWKHLPARQQRLDVDPVQRVHVGVRRPLLAVAVRGGVGLWQRVQLLEPARTLGPAQRAVQDVAPVRPVVDVHAAHPPRPRAAGVSPQKLAAAVAEEPGQRVRRQPPRLLPELAPRGRRRPVQPRRVSRVARLPLAPEPGEHKALVAVLPLPLLTDERLQLVSEHAAPAPLGHAPHRQDPRRGVPGARVGGAPLLPVPLRAARPLSLPPAPRHGPRPKQRTAPQRVPGVPGVRQPAEPPNPASAPQHHIPSPTLLSQHRGISSGAERFLRIDATVTGRIG